MSHKKNRGAPIDRAAPTIRKPRKTDVQKVQVTRSTTQACMASDDWGAAVDVQGAIKVWNKSADDLETNAQAIAALEDQLKTARSKQLSFRRSWRACTRQVLSTVNVFCNGSADTVKGFSFDVLGYYTPPGALAAPDNLTVSAGKEAGGVVASWARGSARHGFVVQYATDPAAPATYSAVMPWTKTKYPLGGAPSKSTVYFHVAAIDPTSPSGLSPWSAWTAGTAR